ncbi:MAG TPA: transglutaminase domain-containing protein [Geothrix sp.]|nr:transglutaminase domain-containing protein [Geothrix sp.]
MRIASPCLSLLASLSLAAQTPHLQTFRQWIGGQEVGGSSREIRQEGLDQVLQEKEWITLSRLGQEIRQEVEETTRKGADGKLSFHWRLQLSAEPFEGSATWSPAAPATLSIRPAQGTAIQKEVPPGALLWPEDLESRLKEAARTLRPLHAVTFSCAIQQWRQLDLEPAGPAPLPGFPEAIRFTGQERQGNTPASVEIWISPTAGEVKNLSKLGSLTMLTQRAELPSPKENPGDSGFFERTLQVIPPQPFLPWLRSLTLRADGNEPALPEDAQQLRLRKGRWELRRAALPTKEEAAQPPLKGGSSQEEARYLAATPLVPFQDPAFDGLLRRMALPPGLSRWDLARRVTTFVFEWVVDKDFSVGFASALEVCRNPRGDCTEHGVLAVALLRKLGVPARGVTGWVALGNTMGLHFWVEVRLLDRWVPVDPTFDQAPASAFRLKLGDTDLADLGSVGWEGASMAFSGVRWVPEEAEGHPWAGPLETSREVLKAPGGVRLRLPGGHWDLHQGQARVRGKWGSWLFTAMTRPSEKQLQSCQKLAGPTSLRQGWWDPAARSLWMDLGADRWALWSELSETEAFQLLDQLIIAP